MTFKFIDSREAFRKEMIAIVHDIEQAQISLNAKQDEAKDGFHRCWKCGDLMCDVMEPYGSSRYFQCFTKGCKGRKEFMQ